VTVTPTPAATPSCGPLSLTDARYVSAAARAPKLPKFKAIKFVSQPLGTTSDSPFTMTIPATTGLIVSSITVSNNDFTATNTCVGQPLPCAISISYRPSRVGASRGKLTIANNIKTINVSLSGKGIGPKVKSLDKRSAPPLDTVMFSGTGFNPNASLFASFTEKVKGQKPNVFLVPATNPMTNSVQVQVPPIFDPIKKEPISGKATVTLQEVFKDGSKLTSRSPALTITPLNQTNSLPPGAATLAFLQAEKDFGLQLQQDVMNTPLSALGDSLQNAVSALDSIITALKNSPNAMLGSIAGTPITESEQALFDADSQILQMLNTMARGSGASAVRARAAASSGCLASEAAQALADMGDPTAFASDIELLFKDSETSTACMQPAPATATLGIVNGAGGVALAITAQAASASVQPLLPTAAVLLASLTPAGQLLSVGASLAQTTPQARQMVQSAVASFNQAASTQLAAVVSQTQGTLNSSYSSDTETAMSFNAATPPPLDGAYAGTFSGQFVNGTCSDAISGSLGLTVQGGGIMVTMPGAGSGTLDPDTGGATFQPAGIGGAEVSCLFSGTFIAHQSASASGSGTWSCTSNGAGSAFNSANGTWSATRQ